MKPQLKRQLTVIDPLVTGIDYLDSPLGWLEIRSADEAICELNFVDHKYGTVKICPVVTRAKFQLEKYFAGELKNFTLNLAPTGTKFQKDVWHALLKVPYGETISYKQLSEKMGQPAAIRAIAAANGANPIPIIIPCHRVIGSDGSLTGYSGGIHIKKKLLEQEAFQPQLSMF